MKSNRGEMVSFRLEADFYKELQKLVLKENTNMSDFIRGVLFQYSFYSQQSGNDNKTLSNLL
jgi:hypothetical protein